MPYFVTELRDYDGNDCTVYDLLIKAETKDAALDKAWEFIKNEWPNDEGDGGEGTFHPCDCRCEHMRRLEDCEACQDAGGECSHGGLLLGTYNVEEYPTRALAKKACAIYHNQIEL